MYKDTPMQELKNKLLSEIQNLKEPAIGNDQIRGYREALMNISNDIEAQMLIVERQVIIDSFDAELMYDLNDKIVFLDGEDYYNKTFGELK